MTERLPHKIGVRPQGNYALRERAEYFDEWKEENRGFVAPSPEFVAPSGAWNAEKVEAFRAAFFEFLGYLRINSKEKGGDYRLVEGLYEAQYRFLDTIFDGLAEDIHDFKCLKSRQLGVSTIARALVIFWLGMHRGMQGAMIFDTESHKEEAREEIEQMIQSLDPDLGFPRILKLNRYNLSLSNNSRLRFMAAGTRTTKSSGVLGRSSGINLVHASEICSWENEEGIVALTNALSRNYPDRLYIWESPLALETPIPTASGWTTMGKIKIGQVIFDDQGRKCEVIGLSPVFINRRCYEITFNNGDSIIADAHHKWKVEIRRWPTNPQWTTKIVTTAELDPANHRIRCAEPIDGPRLGLPIDPYFLGLWLGDGSSAEARISSSDEDIEEFRALLIDRGCSVGPARKYDWRVPAFTVHQQREMLSFLGLLGHKRIPRIYLRASEDQRRELLAGLMDTDGHISKGNFRCEFCSISSLLIDDVAELLSSLGIKYNRSVCSVAGKLRRFPGGNTSECSFSERLRFYEFSSRKVFNLKRKSDVQKAERGRLGETWRKFKYLQIKAIREVASVPVRCMEVNSPTHMFLAGRTMIPTHNTARGFNAWHDMWQQAQKDDLNQRTLFTTWYHKDDQRIPRGTPRFERYGKDPPTEKERERIEEVRELYGFEIVPEQLAWYRELTDPTREREDNEPEDSYQLQDQPWVEDDAFQQTGSTFFEGSKLRERMVAATQKKFSSYKFHPGSDFVTTQIYPAATWRDIDIKVWEEPVHDAVYVISADPAFGHDPKSNYSAVEVGRCYADQIEQVAEFTSTSTLTHQLAYLLWALVGWYGSMPGSQVLVIIEINGPGESVWREYNLTRAIVQNGYLRPAAREKGLTDIFQNARNYVYQRSDSMHPGHNLHWKTTHQLKVAIMERLRDFTHNGGIILNSVDSLEEMKAITRDGDNIGGEGSSRDDRTMSLAMMIRGWEEKLRRALIAQNRTKEADVARRRMNHVDQMQLHNRFRITEFFARKSEIRRQDLYAQQRRALHLRARLPGLVGRR